MEVLPMWHTISFAILTVFPSSVLAVQSKDKSAPSEAEKQAMAKIQQQGGLVMNIAQNDPRLEISFQQRDKKLTDECLEPLKNLHDVVSLNLRGQDVTDARLVFLKDLPSLTRLH